ncbi:MAG: GAF domain-containing protein [Moraxellaceae bacterium]|nr:GAF domain-containing protein [Moraxellaceae bacterium]MBP8852258.1 GAF domain-containing protein [Moraxellaceae bacterium]MBP9045669.1 GAF domain-containing protein [Moraxellaceae bacterium]MBP9730744.1 GAF domain-containing protein [Moraxellaceae bacterium]
MSHAVSSELDQRLFWRLIEISTALSGERNTLRLFERILDAAQDITHADGGTLYLIKEPEEGKPVLEFEIMRNSSLGLRLGGTSGNPIQFAPLPLYREDGTANHNNIATHTALTREMENIEDAYFAKHLDFSGTKAFDERTGYRSKSFLTVPLCNHADEIIGVLQLVNAKDPATGETISFSKALEPIVIALASSAAIALDNQILLQDHKDLLDAFIKVIAQAIDAKSQHTSAHCQRVPVLTELIAQAACETEDGPLSTFDLDEGEWYELRVASWMHDCGKLATPDSVLDKATKLHLMQDGIETVKTRFAAAMAQVELQFLRQTQAQPAQLNALQDVLAAELAALKDDCLFIEKANVGGEFMKPEDQAHVRRIAGRKWVDHLGMERPMLSEEEVKFLCIERGTLSFDERQKINDHMKVTVQMLESLPFPKNLKRVPEYAGGHHEKMDGTGFPRGLKREEMSWPARMMAIADVFEALTASDRPYKQPMKISQALGILQNMKRQNHIDPDLFDLFVMSRVWEKYARIYLRPEQLDITDAATYLQ